MEEIIRIAQPYFEGYGYLIVFLVTLLENSAFVGAFIPGDVVLLAAGFYVQRTDLNLPPVVVLAFFGAIVGDSLGYALGRFAGRRVLDRFGESRVLSRERLARVDRYFHEYGMWAVAIGRLAPVVRTVNTFAAGSARMPYWQFLIAVSIAAAIWAVVVPVCGFLFSGSLEAVDRALGWAGVVVLLLFVAALYLTYRRMSARIAAEALRRRTVD